MKTATPFAALTAITTSVILGLAGKANAVTVTWQAPVNISSSDEVNTQGTTVFATNVNVAYGNNTPGYEHTVNGIDFGYNNPNWTVGMTYTPGGNTNGTIGWTQMPALSGADAGPYLNIVNAAREAYFWTGSSLGPTSSTITFSNLTMGQKYLLQFWVADNRFPSSNLNRTLTLTADGDTASPSLSFAFASIPGQSIIGTFTASATTQNFTVNSDQDAVWNAMQLRAIPEPSAALLGGLGMLCLLRRRK